MDEPWLVVGLGNPGEEYTGTRHNVGAMMVDRLTERLGARLRKVRFSSVHAAEARHEGTALLLAKSGTFMNVSGPPIASFAKRRHIPVCRVRLGVGRPPGRRAGIDYVLDRFPKRQEEDAMALVEEAADAVLALVSEGLAKTQEQFNRNGVT